MYECCFFLITVLHKRLLEHTTANVSCKKYYEGNFESNKNKSLYMTTILICYLIHANIYKHNIFTVHIPHRRNC